MEAAGLLDKVLPPRLEDAGLEDCALPPDSINKAFLKAASAVKSRASALFHSDDEDDVQPGCLDDPFPDNGKGSTDILDSPPCPDMSDVVVDGVTSDPAWESAESCVKEKGVVTEALEGTDVVVVGGDDVEAVDELKGLKIGEKDKKTNGNQEEEEEEEGKEKPVLVEDFV